MKIKIKLTEGKEGVTEEIKDLLQNGKLIQTILPFVSDEIFRQVTGFESKENYKKRVREIASDISFGYPMFLRHQISKLIPVIAKYYGIETQKIYDIMMNLRKEEGKLPADATIDIKLLHDFEVWGGLE